MNRAVRKKMCDERNLTRNSKGMVNTNLPYKSQARKDDELEEEMAKIRQYSKVLNA